MKYTVIWRPSLRSKLADIWLNAHDRNEITRAVAAIDRELGTSPSEVGESRGDVGRILIEHPLAVYYEVSEDDRRVDVLRLRNISRTH